MWDAPALPARPPQPCVVYVLSGCQCHGLIVRAFVDLSVLQLEDKLVSLTVRVCQSVSLTVQASVSQSALQLGQHQSVSQPYSQWSISQSTIRTDLG